MSMLGFESISHELKKLSDMRQILPEDSQVSGQLWVETIELVAEQTKF